VRLRLGRQFGLLLGLRWVGVRVAAHVFILWLNFKDE
jgi:hypothetical protein